MNETIAKGLFSPGLLEDVELRLVLVETGRASQDGSVVPEYKFDMTNTNTGRVVGRIGLRTMLTPQLSEYGGHIGYEVFEEHRGNRYAARSCRLLFTLARKHGIDPILLTCGSENQASRRTCELIGAELVKIRTIRLPAGEYRPTCYYHIHL